MISLRPSGNLVGVIPASAIFFAVYEPLKRTAEGIWAAPPPSMSVSVSVSVMDSNVSFPFPRLPLSELPHLLPGTSGWAPEHKTLVGPIVAGAGAGIAASVVRVPTEVVKQRMQIGEFKSAVSAVRPTEPPALTHTHTHTHTHTSQAYPLPFSRNSLPLSSLRPSFPVLSTGQPDDLLKDARLPAPPQIGSIVQNQGVRGMYAGYGSFLLRDLPFDAIEFLSYEQFKAGAFDRQQALPPLPLLWKKGSSFLPSSPLPQHSLKKIRLAAPADMRQHGLCSLPCLQHTSALSRGN